MLKENNTRKWNVTQEINYLSDAKHNHKLQTRGAGRHSLQHLKSYIGAASPQFFRPYNERGFRTLCFHQFTSHQFPLHILPLQAALLDTTSCWCAVFKIKYRRYAWGQGLDRCTDWRSAQILLNWCYSIWFFQKFTRALWCQVLKYVQGKHSQSGPEDCSVSIVLNSDTGSNLMTSFCQDLINPVVVQGLAGRRRTSDWEEMSLCPFVFPQEWTKHHAECQTELPPQSKPANRFSPLTSGLKRFWKLSHYVADFIHLTASTVYIVLLL